MMIIRHLFFIIAFLPVQTQAQNNSCCCCKKREIGQTAYDKGQYQSAIEKWGEAKKCSDAAKCSDLNDLIKKARGKINQPKPQDLNEHKRECDDDIWEIIKDSDDPRPVIKFLEKYPNSRYSNVAEQRLSKLNEEKKQLESERQALLKKVDVASAVRVKNISVKALSVSSSGKEKIKSSSSSKADKLQICFITEPNEVAPAGEETFYLRIIDPTGAPLGNLGSNNAQGKLSEEEFRYTTTATCNYQNGESNVCGVWQPGQYFVKGKYLVKVFNKGYLVGNGTFNLK